MSTRERLERLYAIGGGNGANRLGFTPEEEEAHRLAAAWFRDAGLEVSHDRAGNLYGRLVGRDPAAPEVWVGSHLDSVPNGGRYDGALGVLAGLAAVERLREPQARTVTVVAFRDEEGSRFGQGFFGSRAVLGALEPGTLDRRDAAGVTLREALAALGHDLAEDAGRLASLAGAYVEVHIEQGPVLADCGAALGIVESIVGLVELDVTFAGRAGHAGTTPMHLRRDAGLCAAAFQLAAADAARAIPDAVVTVGVIAYAPGSGNVIPREARLVVDARAPDETRLSQLERAVRAAAAHTASAYGCEVVIDQAARVVPVVTDPRVRAALAAAAPDAPTLPSGAGHDAQILGAAGVPVGMLFVRSLAGGISHSPLEDTSDEDIEAAVAALVHALPLLCDSLV